MALKTSLAWMGFAQLAAFGLQFAASVVLARRLTPHEMGIYAAAAALVGAISIVQSLGLPALIVREEQLTPEVRATAFTVNALISIGLCMAIAAASVAGGRLLGDARVGRALLTLSALPLFGVFGFLPAATLERLGRFRAISLSGMASGAAGAAAAVAFALMGYSYMSMVYASLIGAAVNAAAMNAAGWRHVNFRIGFTAWRRVADFGLQMLAVSGVTAAGSRLSELAIARLLGLGQLGIYGRASNLNGLIWNNIHMVAGRVLFVDFAELNRQGVSLRDRYLRTAEIGSAVLWPAFAGLGLLAGPFVYTVYGARWLPAAAPLALLALASMLLVASTMTWELFAATGNLRVQTRIEFIRSLVALAAFVIGCTISLEAAAGARVLDAVFAFLLYRPHLNRMTETSLADFAPVYGRSLLLTALATAPAGLLMLGYRFSPQVPAPLVLGAVGCGVVLWAGGLWALKHPLVQEVQEASDGLVGRWRGRAA